MISGPRYSPLHQAHARIQMEKAAREATQEVGQAGIDRQTRTSLREKPAAEPTSTDASRSDRRTRAEARPLSAGETTSQATAAPTRPETPLAQRGIAVNGPALGAGAQVHRWGSLLAVRIEVTPHTAAQSPAAASIATQPGKVASAESKPDDPASLDRPARGEPSEHFGWRRMVNKRIESERAHEERMKQRYPKPAEIDIPMGEIRPSRTDAIGRSLARYPSKDKSPERDVELEL